MMDYSQYLKKWKEGIRHEADFWDELFATKGVCGGNPDVFQYRLNSNCPFQLLEDLEFENSKIIDVGSGPYSRLGFVVNNKKLDITLVDPLAVIYRELGQKYNLKFPIVVKTGMVELLHILYDENSFDLVHMSNSLDHCFDPIRGIIELIFICKVGGKVILRHTKDVAELEKYKGFHQWNLNIENGEFVIWRPNQEKIIVSEIIKEFAEIEYAKECRESLFGDEWIYNKVVIRKSTKFEIPGEYDARSLIISLIEALDYECLK